MSARKKWSKKEKAGSKDKTKTNSKKNNEVDMNDSMEDEESELNTEDFNNMYDENNEETDFSKDIHMKGFVVYRFVTNQYELEGEWGIANEKEKFAYLLNKKPTAKISLKLHSNDISYDESKNEETKNCNINSINSLENEYIEKETINENKDFLLYVSSCNIHELLLIPNDSIQKAVMKFLSGEYDGYFMYFSKTIQDKFLLAFNLDYNPEESEETQIRVKLKGNGTNNLGEFSLEGQVSFYSNKGKSVFYYFPKFLALLVQSNDFFSDKIVVGSFELTRIYVDFNYNENYRVIKSYKHRKKI